MKTCIRFSCENQTANQKFCSRSCSASVNNRNPDRRRGQLKGSCLTCCVEIPAHRKFCSTECQKCRPDRVGVDFGRTKMCNTCKTIKDISKFGVNNSCRDGLMRQCKECNNHRVSEFNRNRTSVPIQKAQYKKHGLALDQYNLIILSQNNNCYICLSPLVSPVIDHDHECCPQTYSCGKCVRGVLCANCNRAIGLFKDNVCSIERAMVYLSRTVGERAIT